MCRYVFVCGCVGMGLFVGVSVCVCLWVCRYVFVCGCVGMGLFVNAMTVKLSFVRRRIMSDIFMGASYGQTLG